MDKLLALKTVLLYKRLQKGKPCFHNFESNLLKCENKYIIYSHQNRNCRGKREIQSFHLTHEISFFHLLHKRVTRSYDCLKTMAKPIHTLTQIILQPIHLGWNKKYCYCSGYVDLIPMVNLNQLENEVKKHEAKIYSKSEDMKHFLNFMNTLICVTVSVITNTCLTLVGCVLISSWLMVAWVRKLMSYVFERKQMFFNLLQWLEYAENEFGDTIWNYVYWAIRTAGPVYTKFIHRITCRLHMFPKWMRLRCEKLQTDVPPHAYAFSVALVNKALKENGAGCHVWIDPVAIGTGCVAQVHRGILQNENGFHIVAVKVLHPDIQKKLERDLKIIRAIGYLFYLIPGSPFTSLKEAIDTFSSEMYHQTNLQEEGKNTQCFHSKLCGMRLRSSSGRIRCNVKIPQIFEKYSTDSVLFETYEDGIALGEFMRLCSDSIDIKKSKEKTKLLSDPKDVTHCNISQKTMSYQNQNDLFLKKKNTSQKVYETASFLFKVIHDVVRERFQNRLDACKEILHHVAAKYGFVPENENEKKDFTSANFRKALTEIGFNLFLTMVFQHRLIHADMHPENILIRFPTLEKRDQTVNNSCLDAKNFLQRVQHIYSQNVQVYKNQLQKSVPLQDPTSEKLSTRKSLIFKSFYSPAVPQNVDFEIVLIDFGLMTKLCEKNYTNIKDVLYSVCLQDGYNIGELLLDRSQCTTCTNRHEFCQNIQDLLNEYFESRGGNITLKNIELGKFFFKMLRIATKYRVQLDSSFLSLTLAALLVENVGKQLYPDINIIPTIFPYVAQTTLNQLKILSRIDKEKTTI